MDKPRSCGCKGCRTCLICEEKYGFVTNNDVNNADDSYVYCPQCDCAWKGWNVEDVCQQHPNHEGKPLKYSGVYIKLNFLSEDEEKKLLEGVDQMPWDLSQSGRRKQNYGPKCNFKKRKLNVGTFEGFPKFSQFVQEKFKEVPILKDFQTIEQCSLEYDSVRGASIDPHIDDCWIWGERIVTVNLLSDSVLTMTFNAKFSRYNLDHVGKYPAVLDETGQFNNTSNCYKIEQCLNEESTVIRIPMPNRSLLVLYNSARYDWEHQILREDIAKRRVCLAYREFTPTYLENGEKYHSEGLQILDKASQFWIK